MMTMRASVERQHPTGETDPYGAAKTAPGYSQLPCYVQPRVARIVTGENKAVEIETLQVFAPLDAGLEPEDVITRVENLAGRITDERRHRVTGVVKRETHIEATAEVYG